MKTYLEVINECASIEMDDSTHAGFVEDYNNILDFFLENVKRDSYVYEFLSNFLTDDEREKYDMWDIQTDVIKAIKDKVNNISDILTFQEAAEIWGKDDSTLRRTIPGSKELVEGIDYRKSGKVWLVAKSAMFKLYGEPKSL